MLKLAALDAEDLAVISAQMQDAVLKVGDISWSPKTRQFALIANRYAWDAGGARQRRRTGLHFDRVSAVRSHNIRRDDGEAVVSLLAITFDGHAQPSGTIELAFSGGGTIRLAVECIEASLSDLGPAWQTPHTPRHPEEA
ncbi:MAG: DUF2948 family protein [Rhizobiales bacterium]|nr:DUF2948 family protein [Hyphomicrobiales bacterium]